jgi:hypothetical protein
MKPQLKGLLKSVEVEGIYQEHIMKINRIMILIIIMGMMIICPVYSVYAQEEGYRVHVRKNFGYNWGNDIQGRFAISLVGDEENVESVTFYVDEVMLGGDNEAPFEVQFNTQDFDDGNHQLFAVVSLKNGSVVKTTALSYDFLNRNETNQQVSKLLIGIGVAIVSTLLVVGLIQMLMIKGKSEPNRQPGEPRNYGLLGGTICPKCGRPFRRHIMGINLLVGRLDRCDNCGKWVMTTRATSEALQKAEQAELETFQSEEKTPPVTGDMEDQFEDTKYFDDL